MNINIKIHKSMKRMEKYLITLSKKIEELSKEHKMSRTEFLESCNVSRSFISNIKKSIPTIDKVWNISKFANCSIDYLLGLTDEKKTVTSDALKTNIPDKYKTIIDKYGNLSQHDKEIVDYVFNMESVKSTLVYRFPIYEQQAAAGAGITGRDGKFTMQDIFTDDIPRNAVFGVHISGTSMINIESNFNVEDIPDNSFVLLNPKVGVPDLNKTIVVASINNDVICKYFLIEQDGIHFYSLNRKEHANDDRFAQSPDEYKIIGQVVKIIKPNEHE